MPSSSRSRVAARRSPRSAPPARPVAPVAMARPMEAPFAAAFGVLVAAEYLFLGWLLYEPGSLLDWYVVVPAVLAALTLAGTVLVVLGRGRGWLVLTACSVVLLLLLLALVLIFGALGGGAALGQGLLLLVGPVGCVALAVRRPVRAWTTRGRRRSPGGRRAEARSR
jgi:hypothetical protein